MSLAEQYEGYKWIKVKRHKDDPTKSWEERYAALDKHHIEETTFLIETLRRLAQLLDETAPAKTGELEPPGVSPNAKVLGLLLEQAEFDVANHDGANTWSLDNTDPNWELHKKAQNFCNGNEDVVDEERPYCLDEYGRIKSTRIALLYYFRKMLCE